MCSLMSVSESRSFFFFQAEDGIRDYKVTGVQTCALPISNLAGKAALVQRGGNDFAQKLQFAADAGAAFAVVYDNVNGTERILMDIDFAPIPGVFITQNDGEALRGYLQTNGPAQAQLQVSPAIYSFAVTNTLVCEHVGVRVQTDHSRRGDLRITLLSPQGTRSVLQQVNFDDTAG